MKFTIKFVTIYYEDAMSNSILWKCTRLLYIHNDEWSKFFVNENTKRKQMIHHFITLPVFSANFIFIKCI